MVPLYVTTYQKAMNKYLYLPYPSHHPQHVFSGIIKGELIRYVKTNTYEKDYLKIAKQFKQRLLARGYPKSCSTRYSNRYLMTADILICSTQKVPKSMSIQASLSSPSSQ
jgi:hypothetical protein